ncbi:MAG: 5-formyltetrahydrofolate cyclo-ligase [Peptococcaceae bacterium]|nr:5-formyltetrahydrofolate cyclo-ligase [Peptococcaceae bacterium]
MTKNEWRARAKADRQSLSMSDRSRQTALICSEILRDPRWQRAQTVLLFLSFGSEWDTQTLIHAAWAQNKTVALTVCLDHYEMQPCRYDETTPLVTTIGHLREIAPEARVPVDTLAIDLCLVPGLLFDPYGHRLGYGAGYYDRFLRKLSPACTILAAGFDCQLVGDRLPAEATDFTLPEIITPSAHLLTRP